MAGDVVVTFETIFDLARKEKDTLELQKIDPSFFQEASTYLADKQRMLTNANTKKSLFSEQESEQLTTQVANIKKMLRDLYDRRQKKVLEMALSKAKTDAVISLQAMLPPEKGLHEEFLKMLKQDREVVLSKLLTGTPSPAKQEQPPEPEDGVLLKFKEHVEQFVGKELEEYGPYEADQTVRLPEDVAKLLITSGKAVEA
ncbi:MAG: hypothetical protein QF486_05285 [Candidatus Woesearchaeota archaeon]|jgi:DNA replication initiation complex subunit (GINS family)|nr:hypothetical protein [Candidatus Woesearchaeota archaeon]MDP7199001.1 hypothetical protein [Candidatus Woesearchaeota archaeon]MDP7467745.1 hypothetical protein [Candidatus Woesearchaeota archaeon]MDP7646829.1 hypothetical protein [Candidatus Woesearchaeota archaeon]